MKVLSIGDVHGRTYWKSIEPSKYDKIVFDGDYCDQYPPMTDDQILRNLKDIIEFKKTYPDKVVLLLGNHDIHYKFLNEGYDGWSGFRPSMAAMLNFLFKENEDLFQIAFQIDNYLWTHAGVTNGWYEYNKKEIIDVQERFDTVNLADTFNHMLKLKENRLLHQISIFRSGYYQYGGITWADRKETSNDYLLGYHQIVGHTPINMITKFGDDKGSIRYIDVQNEAYFHDEDQRLAKEKYGDNFTPKPYALDLFHELTL